MAKLTRLLLLIKNRVCHASFCMYANQTDRIQLYIVTRFGLNQLRISNSCQRNNWSKIKFYKRVPGLRVSHSRACLTVAASQSEQGERSPLVSSATNQIKVLKVANG